MSTFQDKNLSKSHKINMTKDELDDNSSSRESPGSLSLPTNDHEDKKGPGSDFEDSDIEVIFDGIPGNKMGFDKKECGILPIAQIPSSSYPYFLESNCFDAELNRPISPDSEGFPLSPQWDNVDGFSVNIEESIVDVLENRRLEDDREKGNSKGKKKQAKGANRSKVTPKRNNALRATKKAWSGIKKRPKSSAFEIR